MNFTEQTTDSIERQSLAASASQLRPHLADQIDFLADNPGVRAHQVPGAGKMALSDRRFLTRLAMLLR